jgi:hypothetical protein
MANIERAGPLVNHPFGVSSFWRGVPYGEVAGSRWPGDAGISLRDCRECFYFLDTLDRRYLLTSGETVRAVIP